jgi:glyoxylase-like metal-dependent hydrolase (beta-lactamase superfamily II)
MAETRTTSEATTPTPTSKGAAVPVEKQEKRPARPEISEVAPGILRAELPISMPGLGHVNCYVLEDERGVAVVDPGLPGPASYDALVDRLEQAGIPLARIHTVVITHSHPDHYGGAHRLHQELGAEILTHRSFRRWWDATEPDGEDPEVDERAPRTGPWDRPTPWGGQPYRPAMEGRSPEQFRSEMATHLVDVRPTVRVDDADVVRLARRDWVAMHTPGHTSDHLCLYDPVEGVVLSGDHVLPTITPHISGIGDQDDPLAEFFHSLERMTTLTGVRIALPAHGDPFTDLAGRAVDIRHHHEERLTRLRRASNEMGRAASVHELMQHLFSERAWGSMAESETYAHLEHLRLLGQAESHWESGLLYYEVA